MSAFAGGADCDPVEIEKYVVSNIEFFKRWALNNITLNQLNAILIEQQMMPAPARVPFSVAEDGVSASEADGASSMAFSDTSKLVNCYLIFIASLVVIFWFQFYRPH